jgi:hypothetical protein
MEHRMEVKDQIDACLRLSQLSYSRFDGRRQYEWKIALGLWAILFAAVRFHQEVRLPTWTWPLVLVGYAFLWQRGLHVANRKDKDVSLHFQKQAEQLVCTPDSHVVEPYELKISWYVSIFGFLGDWASQCQLATTGVLCWAAWKCNS